MQVYFETHVDSKSARTDDQRYTATPWNAEKLFRYGSAIFQINGNDGTLSKTSANFCSRYS